MRAMTWIVMVGTLAACGGGEHGADSTADAGTTAGTTGGGTSTSGPQPFKAAGKAVDTKGAPIAGAKVQVCNPIYWGACMSGATGADGRYSMDLPPGNVWEIETSIQKTFDGRVYCLDLKPDATVNFSSEAGAVRNFAWAINGPRPDGVDPKSFTSYYGGAAEVAIGDFNRPVDPATVQVHFVPAGAVIDGSAAVPFSANAADWVENTIGNIPIAPYTVTAEYVAGATHLPLLVGTDVLATPAASMTLHFDPLTPGICVGQPLGKIYVFAP